jgi:hypothetical protein
MNRLIQRLQLLVFAALLVVLGFIAYQQFFVLGPYQRCEKFHAWYSPADHRCARVLYVPNITHRYRSDPRIPTYTARKDVAGKPVAK